MSFLDIFSQWDNLDRKNQRENPKDMIFPTVNCKTTKKFCLDVHLYYEQTVNRCFSGKINFQIKPFSS